MTKSKKRAFSIRIFLPEGTADGLRLVEKSNWSGRGFVCPRAVFPESKKREEFASTGVYVLVGPSESGDLPIVYVGQGDPVRPRLESHYAKKDFWTYAVFFVSNNEHLNKAHIQYLESRLIAMAKEAKRCVLDNANTPVLPSMSEMDVADAEGFLDELLLCLPVIGLNVFAKPSAPKKKHALKLTLRGSGATAEGYEAADGFVVLAGGVSRKSAVKAIHKHIVDLRKRLLETGVFVTDGDHYRLAQDYTFNSPSLAAAVMMARNANGRTEWKAADGRTLKQIQEASSGQDAGDGAK